MGVFDTKVITTTVLNDRVSSLVNDLDSLDGISAEQSSETYSDVEYVGALFTLDGTNVSGFFGYNDNLKVSFSWIKNGDIYLVEKGTRGSGSGSSGNLTINSYIDEGCKLVSLTDAHTDNDGLQFALVETIKGDILVGYRRFQSTSFQDISSMTFENIADTGRTQYSYTNMFPYAAAAGTLDFLAKAYFVNNGVRKYTTEAMKECSTVTLLSTVSLPAPLGNHVAIGTHCIVPITEEGGDE